MKKISALLISCILITACKNSYVSPIKFNNHGSTYDLAVEGGITTFQTSQQIRLSKPGLLPDGKTSPVSNALVSVNDGTDEISFKETQTPGLYAGTITNNTNYDGVYTLHITYNKVEYTAADVLSMVTPSIQLNNLPFSARAISADQVQLKIPKHLFGAPTAARWIVIYDKSSITNLLNSFVVPYIYTHQLGAPNSLYSSTQEFREPVLSLRDSITVYKFSLSESYSQYLYTLFQETDWKNIFSTNPSGIYGNISGTGQGYFYCTDYEMKKIAVKDLIK
ncbi:hypothetical protein G7092_03300 [Mucilaginibacter sp. HC2]|uniref:DUF4249 family protein n=1 Tax=Mucilaginibacter inviolabilis TaxID=2714892 RepID=UPI00140813EA|nr:DUF4249 family protein [Mucilaginibacter inviolabilis]NHA02802.1 hypothetical protein [Mucilaginibacter inviolabilis]